MKKSPVILISVLLVGHILLSISAMLGLSPTWDEISYPLSGAMALATRSLSFYPYNPFLARLFYGLPALIITPEKLHTLTKLATFEPAMAGYLWFYHVASNPILALLATRLPALMFSLIVATFLLVISLDLWGASGAVISLAIYLSIPIFLSRASLALLEMPMFAFMLGALWSYKKWLSKADLKIAAIAAFFSALACLCKFAAFPMVAVLGGCLFFEPGPKFKQCGVYVGIFLAVFFGGFFIWKGSLGSLISNWHAAFDFNQRIPFYWAGRYRENASSLLSWAALALKAPPVPWILFIWALVTLRSRARSLELRPWLLLIFIYLLMPLFFSAPASTIQLSPLYLGVAVLVGSLGVAWNQKTRLFKSIVVGLLVLGWADALHAHPNYLAYFNPLAGGMNRGSYWLADSDQDWGQSLPSLAAELRRRPPGLVLLSYSGAGDPVSHGVFYFDLVSAALVSHEHQNRPLTESDSNGPIYVAIGTKMKQIAPEFFDWLEKNRHPLKIVDGTFELYEVTKDPEALHWLSSCYASTRRPQEAAWFDTLANRFARVKS